MAGKHKKKQVKRKRLSSTISSGTNSNQVTTNTTRLSSSTRKSKSKINKKSKTSTNISPTPEYSNRKNKKRIRDTPISSADSDTGSQLSKRRRRETRNTTATSGSVSTFSDPTISQQLPHIQHHHHNSHIGQPSIASTSSFHSYSILNPNPNTTTNNPNTGKPGSSSTTTIKSRRRRNIMLNTSTGNNIVNNDSNSKSTNNAYISSTLESTGLMSTSTVSGTASSSNAQHTGTTSTPTSLIASTSSRSGKRSTNKPKAKFAQFNLATSRDPGIFLSGDNTFQGIVSSSGVDISHFQNYLSSRSMSSTDIGEQINKKIDELRSSSGDRTQEYMIMTEINQHLLVSYEDSLNSLRVGELVSQVVTLIQNCEDNLVDLKTICYNILLHLIEAMPRSSDYLVSSLSMFLNKISNLFDFDSLEQIINVIERISRRHGQAVLQSGAFTTIINYYDFLTAPQQLTILNMICQCFQNLRSTDFSYIVDGIDNLTSRLKQSEPKCVDKVIQCFVRLVNAYQYDQIKLKRIASNNTLFANLQELLICSPPVISDVREIIQMMSVLCANCPDLAVDLIKQNVTQTILCICNTKPITTNYTNSNSNYTVSTMFNSNTYNNSRSMEEVLALVTLISELMPPLPLNNEIFIINKILNTRHIQHNYQMFQQQLQQSQIYNTNTNSNNNSSSTSSSSNTATMSIGIAANNNYSWFWFNSNTKQWICHPPNICQMFEKNLQTNEFQFECQSNNMSLKINIILMQQTHISTINNNNIISDLKRSKQSHHHHGHHGHSKQSTPKLNPFDEIKKDARSKLAFQQCSKFENFSLTSNNNGEIKDELEIVEMIRNLFPLVIDIYHEASSFQIKYKCLEAMIRMVYPTSSKVLNFVLNKASLSSLMASLLSNQDATIIIHSIQMATLLQKLPHSLIINFKKEGVLHQLEKTLVIWEDKQINEQDEHGNGIMMSVNTTTPEFETNPGHTNLQSGLMIDNENRWLVDQTGVSTGLELPGGINPSTNVPAVTTNSSSSNVSNNSTSQRFTNWVKRTSCIGGTNNSSNRSIQSTDNKLTIPDVTQPTNSSVGSTNSAVSSFSSKITRKQKSESDQALDMSMRPPVDSGILNTTASSSNMNTSRKINQIMSLLNLNSSSLASVYSSGSFESSFNHQTIQIPSNVHDRSPTDYSNFHYQQHPQKEFYCKHWILKFGSNLNRIWQEISNESANNIEKTTLLNTTLANQLNPHQHHHHPLQHQKKDVLFYLKEVARDLLSENKNKAYNALKLYSELLTNDCYISVFEMESSGINEALLQFIVPHNPVVAKSGECSKRQNLLMFLKVFTSPSNTSDNKPFICLVNHLMMCLHQQEQFHVRMFQFPVVNTGSIVTPLSQQSNTINNTQPESVNVNSSTTSVRTSIPKFSLTQALTEAVLGRMAAHRRSSNNNNNSNDATVRNLESSILEARILPNIVLESNNARQSLTTGYHYHQHLHHGGHNGSNSNKLTDIHCNFSPYPHDSHPLDSVNGLEKWTGSNNTSNNNNVPTTSSNINNTNSNCINYVLHESGGFNSSFSIIVDVLSTVNSLEKTVMREISKHRRLNKRFGMLSKEMASINDSSDSDDDEDEEDYDEDEDDDDDDDDDDDEIEGEGGEYDCDDMNESLMSSEMDFYDHKGQLNEEDEDDEVDDDDMSDLANDSSVLNTSDLPTTSGTSNKRKLTSINTISVDSIENSSAKSTLTALPEYNRKVTRSHKSRTKTKHVSATINKSNATSSGSTFSKLRVFSRKPTSQPVISSKSHAAPPIPTTSVINDSNDSHILPTAPSTSHQYCNKLLIGSQSDYHNLFKPITKIQIFIGETLLPTEMSLYQAIRRYSSHVINFNNNYQGGKTDQQLEETINQIIWKSQHNFHYRTVTSSSNNQLLLTGNSGNKSAIANYYNRSLHSANSSLATMNFISLLNSASTSKHSVQSDIQPTLQNYYNSIGLSQQQQQQHIIGLNNSNTATPSRISTRQRNLQKKNTVLIQKMTKPPTAHHTSSSPQLTGRNNNNTSTNKRRRKNNTDSLPLLGRNSNSSQKILIDHLTNKLPYPVLIDYPTIFEPIPNTVSGNIKGPSGLATSNEQSLDKLLNIPTKLETTLSLLRCLYILNKHWHVLNFNLNSNSLISEFEFRSQKLTSKVNRQLQDIFYVLARNIPFWCVQLLHTCAFLFSLETRQTFFYLFNFDRARTLIYLEGSNNQDSDNLLDSSSSEIRRVRVQVNRSDRLLDESELLLKNQTDSRVLLEISFSNEAGFGLGPTNEFYTQVSKCLMKSNLMLWYTSTESPDEYVMPSFFGLYPKPIMNKNKKLDNKIRNKFVFLGRLLARALLDCRKLDLPLNPVFYKWILGQEESINSADMNFIDPNLSNQLKSLHEIVDRKLEIEVDKTMTVNQKKLAIEELGVEELQIVHVHPIFTQIELVKGGSNRVVSNCDELSVYLDTVATITLVDGVRAQMECVIEGFDSLLPGARYHLGALFEPASLDQLFCGGQQIDDENNGSTYNHHWDVRSLTEACTCDHGYTMASRSIVNLFEIMSEFDKDQRRSFVQFCTGSSRLPVGGFKALRPLFKIVNKKEGGENPDNYLPSVMTCQNFLKLPDYSTKEIMRQRLLYALHEGQNAFYLS